MLCEQVNVLLCHAPLAIDPGDIVDIHLASKNGLCDLLERRTV